MTEIIDFLKKYTDGKQNTEKVEISVLQLKRVIKALEQQPCEDTISRQAAIDAVRHAWAKGLEPTQFLEELPSVQPEIIRCKDCRYTDEYGVCQSSKGLAIQDDDDFCSHAERRGG